MAVYLFIQSCFSIFSKAKERRSEFQPATIHSKTKCHSKELKGTISEETKEDISLINGKEKILENHKENCIINAINEANILHSTSEKEKNNLDFQKLESFPKLTNKNQEQDNKANNSSLKLMKANEKEVKTIMRRLKQFI